MFNPHRLFSAFFVALSLFALSAAPSLAQTPPSQSTQTVSAVDRERGIAFFQQGKSEQAVPVLRAAIKKDKTDHQAWYFLGLAQIKLDDLKEATKSLQSLVKLQPDFAAGHNALGYTYLLRNKSEEAIREAQFALHLDPKITEAHYVLGVAQLRKGNKDEALRQAEAVIKLDPKFAAAYLLKSQAITSFLGDAVISKPKEPSEARKSRYLEAATALEKFLELNPNAEHKQTWIEQLESLRFYVVSHKEGSGPDRVYPGPEVTTKARVLAKPEPQYTEEARLRRVTGTVILRCIFASDGTVKHFLVLRGLPHGLTEKALAAARKIKFTPAQIDGKPVSMFIQLEYNFNLY